MTVIKSSKKFFELANGKNVTREAVDMITIEGWDDFVANAEKQLASQGCTDITFDKDGNLCAGRQIWRKPKVSKTTKGIMVVRSKDYIFQYDQKESFGDKTGAKVIDNKLVIETIGGGSFHYTID